MYYLLFLIIYLFFCDFLLICLFSLADYKKKINFFDYLKRFGFDSNIKKTDFLIHAASCGEALTALPITNFFKSKNINFKISVNTCTGYNLIKNYTQECILKPYDNFFLMLYFILKLRPKNLLIIENDFWPFFILISKIFNVKIFFFNYKIKKKRFILNKIHYLIAEKIYLVQDFHCKDLKYRILGNLKTVSAPKYIEKNNDLIIVIASAGENEINIHLNFIKYILESNINCKIVYIPRHLTWEKKLKNLLNNFDYLWIQNYTDISLVKQKLIIGWCYGILNKIYEKSHICIMGDTFNLVGGHNIIEPAINKNLIMIGPNHHTCNDLIDIFASGIILVDNLDSLILKIDSVIYTKEYIKLGVDNYNRIIKHQDNISNNLKNELEKIIKINNQNIS